jgi:hypothetical protein
MGGGTDGTGGVTVAQPASTRPAPARARLTIWDSDKETGKGWSDCDQKPSCKSAVSKEGGTTGSGSGEIAGVRWHAEGSGWAGMGWNWFGWWPESAGSDLSPYGTLTFQIRVVSKSPASGPDPAKLTAFLRCSNGKKETAAVPIGNYAANFADGRWHRVVIPIADLLQGKGATFDATTAWELNLNHWSAAARDFDVYVDDIAAET